jgi:glyoxylase-like metal-dependent hydrolase (beta-lactamase superfamily II)
MPMTRRDMMKIAGVAGLGAAFMPGDRAGAAAGALAWKHYPANENGFFRAPVLISGAKDAILIDGGFTVPDGQAVAAAIRASGKNLTTIYVSQSDPDYYFSLEALKQAFPRAKIIAAKATVDAIKASLPKKLEIWGPKLGAAGPKDVRIPAVDDTASLTLEGNKIDIVNAKGLANRRYLWVPSLQAVFGGVLVFGGLHVWTADTPAPEQRKAWITTLEEIEARRPKVVVPGHMAPNSPTDVSAVKFTREYLVAFEQELASAKDSVALIEAMKKRYPNAGLGVALEIGAKVAKGEMKWG